MNKPKPKTVSRIQIDSKRPKSLSKAAEKILETPQFADINKLLMSKIDDMLLHYKGYENLVPQIDVSISTKDKSEINKQDEIVENIKEENLPSLNIKNNERPISVDRNKKILPKVKTKKKQNKIKNPFIEGGFLTDVHLTKALKNKSKKNNERQNKFLAKTDEEINEVLRNIDDIDNMFTNRNYNDNSFEGSPDFIRRMEKDKKDFQDLLRDIDSYKNNIKEDFDEIKYLIKFTDNTEKLIQRHKNVIGSIFKGAGLKTKKLDDDNQRNLSEEKIYQKKIDESDYESDDDEYQIYNNTEKFVDNSIKELNKVFYKMKKINKIKDNLCSIQDDCLDYHEKLKENMKRSESAKPLKKNSNIE
jgi:hypothetical protein